MRHAHRLTTHHRTAPHPRIEAQGDLRHLPHRAPPHPARSSARVRRPDPGSNASPWLTESRTRRRISRPRSDVSATRARPRAVVRFTAEMLGTDFMAAYPWSREHGWAATN